MTVGLPKTPRLEQIIRRAEEIAGAIGNDWVGTEHLVMALFEGGRHVSDNLQLAYSRVTLDCDLNRVRERLAQGTHIGVRIDLPDDGPPVHFERSEPDNG